MITTENVIILIAVGVAVIGGAIGSSLGVSHVGKLSAGLLSKEPKKFAQALILTALPSTQALYGLLFGFILLIQTGMLSGTPFELTMDQAYAFALSALPVSVCCALSGIYQGQVAGSGVKILAHKPEGFSSAIILASLVESFAIFGLVISLLIVFVGIPL